MIVLERSVAEVSLLYLCMWHEVNKVQHRTICAETARKYGSDVLDAGCNEMIVEHAVPDWPFESWLAWIRQELLSHESRASGCSCGI